MRAISSTLLILGLCIAAPSLRASVSFTSGNGSTCGSGLCFSSGTFNVTATAYSTSVLNTPTSALTNTNVVLGQYSFGLGVCDNAENTASGGCQSPQHAIDDNGGYVDFVLLTFSQPVTSITLTLNPFQTVNDSMDVSYITGTGAAPTVNGKTLAQLGTTVNVTGLNSGNPYQDQSFTVNPASSVSWILVGADVNQTDNYFKLQSMSYSTTPEPATFVLAGSALLGLGLLRRKKRSVSV